MFIQSVILKYCRVLVRIMTLCYNSKSRMRSWWWPLSIKMLVLGIDRGRGSFPADLTCKRRLKMFWVQKMIILIFCVNFLKSFSVGFLIVLLSFNQLYTQNKIKLAYFIRFSICHLRGITNQYIHSC